MTVCDYEYTKIVYIVLFMIFHLSFQTLLSNEFKN